MAALAEPSAAVSLRAVVPVMLTVGTPSLSLMVVATVALVMLMASKSVATGLLILTL